MAARDYIRRKVKRKPFMREGWEACSSNHIGHMTRAMAKKAAERLRLSTGEVTDVFPCNECGRWHHGHPRIIVGEA